MNFSLRFTKDNKYEENHDHLSEYKSNKVLKVMICGIMIVNIFIKQN